MVTNPMVELDKKYLDIILKRVRVSKQYKPKFGKGKSGGFTLEEFQKLYGSDPFYAWFGLDNPLIYAAHRAAGGITSVYRQIGIGCEELFRQVLQDHLGLSAEQAKWSYELTTQGSRTRKLSLDGRIQLKDVISKTKRENIASWLNDATSHIRVSSEIASVLKGIVFEVRQGYKSKDSKRQNADIANASSAYSQGYFPVFIVLSAQIDNDIAERYENASILVLRGHIGSSSIHSTYAFMRDVVGYDLQDFFQRNSATLKAEISEVTQVLLTAND